MPTERDSSADGADRDDPTRSGSDAGAQSAHPTVQFPPPQPDPEQYGPQQPYPGSGYGPSYPQPTGEPFSAPYGQQYAEHTDEQFTPPYGQQYPAPYGQQYPAPYGQQYPAVSGAAPAAGYQHQPGFAGPAETSRRRSPRAPLWLTVCAVLVVLAVGAVLAFLTPGFLVRTTFDETAVATTIQDQSKGHGDFQHVTCPSGEPVTKGTTFTCTADGGREITVRVTSSSGDYTWEPAA